MAYETKATLRIDGRVLSGVASLEMDRIAFRGDAQVDVPFAELTSIDAQGDWLELRGARGLVLFEVGASAGPWAERIKNPKVVAEKLALGPGKKVAVVGKAPDALRRDLAAGGATVAKTARGDDFGVVVVTAFDAKALPADVDKALRLVAPDGIVWALRDASLATPPAPTERELLTAGRTRGLVDSRPVRVGGHVGVRFVLSSAAKAARRNP